MSIFNTIKKAASTTVANLEVKSIEVKSITVKQATDINYDNVMSKLKDVPVKVPQSITHGTGLLKEAAEKYNNSSSENKDDEYIDFLCRNLDAQLILKDIEPIVRLIPPYGTIIVYLLRFILKRQQSRNS